MPHTGHISPEAMAAGLAGSPRLDSIEFCFQDEVFHSDRTPLPPVTRTVLPALTSFSFSGVTTYLEDLVARMDCPQLNRIRITYTRSTGHVDFQVSQLFKFINLSEDPRLTHFRWADVCFQVADSHSGTCLNLYHEPNDGYGVDISLYSKERSVPHLMQLLGEFSAMLSDVPHLSILPLGLGQQMGHSECVQVLRLFTAAQTLYVYGYHAREFALELEAVDRETVAGLLPALDLVCLDSDSGGPRRQEIHIPKFDAARRLSGLPITIVENPRELYEIRLSYDK